MKCHCVVIGIRPEYVSITAGADTSPVAIKLDLVEPLGSEALLHAAIADEPFIIKAETLGDVSHLSGLTEVHVPASMVKVFDAETGHVLNQEPKL